MYFLPVSSRILHNFAELFFAENKIKFCGIILRNYYIIKAELCFEGILSHDNKTQTFISLVFWAFPRTPIV